MHKLSKDQAMGSYIGMAVGDAYGAPFEFIPKDELKIVAEDSGFKAAPVYWSGGVHDVQAGEWTDDTAMARCITYGYFENDSLDKKTIMHNFADWKDAGEYGTRDYCFDIGGTCSRAIESWRKGVKLPEPSARNGQGNGGIMRLAPVIVFNSQNYKKAVADAVETSSYTHDNDICALYAECVIDVAFNNHKLEHILPESVSSLDGSGHVEETFWNAMHCVATTDNFLDAIHAAVMLGGDTDSTAAVTGIIAGAKYGLSGIPSELVNGLNQSDILLYEAGLLYDAGVMIHHSIN